MQVILPEGVTEVLGSLHGDGAFSNCLNLRRVVFPATLTAIGNRAFSGCARLAGTPVLPAGLVEIGDEAFAGCPGLEGDLVLGFCVRVGAGAWDASPDLAVTHAELEVPGVLRPEEFLPGITAILPGQFRSVLGQS